MTIEKKAMHIDEFCLTYGIGRTKYHEEVAAGRLIARKFGKRSIITKEDADAWLAALPKQDPASSAA